MKLIPFKDLMSGLLNENPKNNTKGKGMLELDKEGHKCFPINGVFSLKLLQIPLMRFPSTRPKIEDGPLERCKESEEDIKEMRIKLARRQQPLGKSGLPMQIRTIPQSH